MSGGLAARSWFEISWTEPSSASCSLAVAGTRHPMCSSWAARGFLSVLATPQAVLAQPFLDNVSSATTELGA